MNITDLDKFINRGPIPTDYPANRRTLYSPIDDVHAALVAVLSSATRSVVLSMYGWTDDELAKLVDAQLDNPAIYCQITLDSSQYAGKTESQVLFRFRDNLESNVIAVGRSERGEIIHRKMLIIDGVWTVTGSTNWSLNGEQKQDNELTVTYDANVAAEARHILDLSHAKALTDMAKAQAKRLAAGGSILPPVSSARSINTTDSTQLQG